MWRRRFRGLITIGGGSGEGTRSGLPLTEGPREWYVYIKENMPLIGQQGGNWGRRKKIRTAAEPIRGSKNIGDRCFGR
jgi:hypothetical protein